jgi:hypothetical protein
VAQGGLARGALEEEHLVVAPPGAVAVGNHESEGLAWVRRDELAAKGVDGGTLRLADAAIAALADLRAAGLVAGR